MDPAPQFVRREISQLESNIHFEVLYVEPRDCTRDPCRPQNLRRTKKRWRNQNDNVRAPENVSQHHWPTAEREAYKMDDSFPAAWHLGDPDRATEHLYRAGRSGAWNMFFSFVLPWGVFAEDSPLWIMRRRRNHPDLMTTIRKPFNHFSCIFAGTCQFRLKINGTNQDTHIIC